MVKFFRGIRIMLTEAKFYNILNIALFSDYRKLKDIREKFGSWQKAAEASKISADPEKEWLKIEKNGVRLILNSDPDFPAELKEIPWPPFGIYLKGAALEKEKPRVAMVGTRKATLQGRRTAKNFGRELAEKGVIVVSGLALGIDASSHEGVVEAHSTSSGQAAKTIAVLAHGLDQIYPRQNERLAEKILEFGGTLISEYPIGAPSLPQRFIERNRLVSGLSLGTVIIEGPKDSGSMATARFAIEQNREVMVVPGDIANRNFEGSHELIKTGAALITNVRDILAALNLENLLNEKEALKRTLDLGELDEIQKAVILAIQGAGGKLTVDRISESAKLEISDANSALSFLVIKGVVKEENGRYYI